MGEGKEELSSGGKPRGSKENFLPDDFPKNEEVGEGMGEAFLDEKREGNDPTKGGLFEVTDDGQLVY